MDEKPKNFKEAALSHIPAGIIQSMENQAAVTEADMKKLHDKVTKHGPTLLANPELIRADNTSDIPVPQVKPPVKQAATMTYAVNGHVIAVPSDGVGAGIQLFYALLALVWGKDKKIAKVLKQFDFKFFDANGKQIYPEVKSGKK